MLSPCPSPRRTSSARGGLDQLGGLRFAAPEGGQCPAATYGAEAGARRLVDRRHLVDQRRRPWRTPPLTRAPPSVSPVPRGARSAHRHHALAGRSAQTARPRPRRPTQMPRRGLRATATDARPRPDMSSPRKALTALLNVGVPAAYPSVISSARPSSSRSDARGGCDAGGAALAARAVSSTLASLARRRRTNTAVSASR